MIRVVRLRFLSSMILFSMIRIRVIDRDGYSMIRVVGLGRSVFMMDYREIRIYSTRPGR